MSTDTGSSRPPPSVVVTESDRLTAARAALESGFEEARPHIMRWSVVTTTLRDLVRSKANVDLSWVEIAHVASRWVEDLRGKGYSMAPAAASLRPPAPPPASSATARPEGFIERHGPRLLRIAFGVMFVWFGFLKPIGQSPAAGLIVKAMPWAPPSLALHLVGWWEVATGICLFVPRWAKAAVVLLAVQLPMILLPLLLAPEACFLHVPYALTIEGQSLLKDLLLVAAAVVLVRSSSVSSDRR